MSQLNATKFIAELNAAGLTVVNPHYPDGTRESVYFDKTSGATDAQIAQAQSILAAHDGTLPLGLVSATTTGAKLIGIVGATGSAFLPRDYTVYIRAAVGVTGAPTVSLGTNSPNYNNLQPAVSLAGWNTADIQNFFMSAKTIALLAPTPVYLNVTVAARATQFLIGALFNGQVLQIS